MQPNYNPLENSPADYRWAIIFLFGRRPRFNRSLSLKRFLPFLPREFAVGEPLPDNLAYRSIEAVGIIQRIISCGTIVKTKRLLVNVTEQMERFYSNVGSAESTLQERPKILHALSVYLPVNVFLKMIDDFMVVIWREVNVARVFIGHDSGASLNKITHGSLHGGILAICDDTCFYFSAALQSSNNYSLAVTA